MDSHESDKMTAFDINSKLLAKFPAGNQGLGFNGPRVSNPHRDIEITPENASEIFYKFSANLLGVSTEGARSSGHRLQSPQKENEKRTAISKAVNDSLEHIAQVKSTVTVGHQELSFKVTPNIPQNVIISGAIPG